VGAEFAFDRDNFLRFVQTNHEGSQCETILIDLGRILYEFNGAKFLQGAFNCAKTETLTKNVDQKVGLGGRKMLS